MPFDIYIADWLNLVLRWAHVIAAIAWIGSSFYFIWLDARLNVPPLAPEHEGVAGDLWAIHGGGFYHSQKYQVVPPQLPEPLHWFKWEAYFTWITGFLLMTVVYYLNAEALLVDPGVAELSGALAIATSVGLLAAGWLVYDGICRLQLRAGVFALVGAGAVLGLSWSLSQLFSGRGLFMQIGAMLGTIMAANVLLVIIPSQKQLVAAMRSGTTPDALLGLKAKQRSVHNNYLTLPVVFAMISPHFAMTYAHAYNWLVLFVLFMVGATVRHYFNLRNRGRHVLALPVAAAILVGLLAAVIAPRGSGDGHPYAGDGTRIGFAEVRRIIDARCVTCHSSAPTHPTAPVAAAGVMFDSPRDIAVWAPRIVERVVVTRTMPLANLTDMTDEERGVLRRWYAAGAKTD